MATIKRFRCLNPKCQTQEQGIFESQQPTCPQCSTAANDPKFGRLIVRLSIIHFDPPTDVPGFGKNHRACDPGTGIQAATDANGVPNPWHGGTGNVFAVTCSACKETPEYLAAIGHAADEDAGTEELRAALDRLPITPG